MDRSPLIKFLYGVISAAFLILILACTGNEYKGEIDTSRHSWLKGRKIFVDAGHGGTGASDAFRKGPNSITEEDINLKVALVLESMLEKAGADVEMTRRRDKDVSLDDRAAMVMDFSPDLLVSIHHNGSPRRADGINYPCVFIWGSADIKPESYDFAGLLLEEFHKIMDEKGMVLSDFSVFHETGTRILRLTAQTCAGVIGEAGFFSDEKHSARLADDLYRISEAEAYFNAISRYFQWGLPRAEVYFSSPMSGKGFLYNEIKDRNPDITIKVYSDNENKGIDVKTLKITLDDVPVSFKKIDDDHFKVLYGKKLYPGGHSLRFHFRNLRQQSSMVLRAPFTVTIRKGDYDRLVKEGRRLIDTKSSPREGLKMLLSAYSMALTDPGTDRLLTDISRGFRMIGETGTAGYYEKKLVYFYPDSPWGKKIREKTVQYNSYRFPVEYYGTPVQVKTGAPYLIDKKGQVEEGVIKKIFKSLYLIR